MSTLSRFGFLILAIASLAIFSWACSSTPEPVDPTATAESLPTNTQVPPSTSDPADTPSPDSTPTAPPTTRDWNVLGDPNASVTIADFGDFM